LWIENLGFEHGVEDLMVSLCERKYGIVSF
jgi:hypothetical protein